MNNKELIASELAKVIDSLDQDAILNLLEQPKSSDLGDIAFPAFSLAKVERKAPQAIAADIAEKIDQSAFEKVVATGPYVNFFLDKSKISDQVIKSVIEAGADYGQQDEGTSPSTFQVQTSQNHSQLVTCAQPLSGMLFQTSSAKWATTRLKSTTWGTGVNSSVS